MPNIKLKVGNFIHFSKTEIIKNKWQLQDILNFQYTFKIHSPTVNFREDYSLETTLAYKYYFSIKICKKFA